MLIDSLELFFIDGYPILINDMKTVVIYSGIYHYGHNKYYSYRNSLPVCFSESFPPFPLLAPDYPTQWLKSEKLNVLLTLVDGIIKW